MGNRHSEEDVVKTKKDHVCWVRFRPYGVKLQAPVGKFSHSI